jgi:hypothetical protein
MSSRGKIARKLIGIFICLFIVLNILMTVSSFREGLFSSKLFSQDYRYISLIVPLGLSIITSYWGLRLAERKNRNRKIWAVACFFLNIWGIIILYLLPPLAGRPTICTKEPIL